MKTLVVTDQEGVVTGLIRFEEEKAEGAPDEVQLEPVEGQLVHEIELPAELERMDSILEIYEVVEREYRLDVKALRLTKRSETSA
jgi:hypothetical protein